MISYNMKRERKEKYESYNVLNLVWNNHCDARSHIKGFSKLKKFDPICKCPLKESRLLWRTQLANHNNDLLVGLAS